MTLQRYEVYGIRSTYIEYNNSGVIAFKRCYMTAKCDLKVTTGALEFAGDGQKIKKNYGYELDGTVEFDIEDNTVDSILFATPAVSPSGGDDFAARYYKGTNSELQTNYVGLRISLDAADHDTGAPCVIRYRVLKVQFAPDTPPSFATEAKVGRMLSWNARKTKVDIVGNALTNIPADGAFFIKDYITNSTYFDPVANDND